MAAFRHESRVAKGEPRAGVD
ncbi:Hypothetical protein PFCIRM119_06965 [Propionibacterium freudenreichii]|uniref:Uncharacterized protein n=2 Tax=Propionibacterium freudenreichii TaxID=1744 RepID=D7GG17_PROFC|nr:Hypothetical protein PFREUD_19850 [Propionibacterium freudenreichii subsp. shermanii CIRM-BIA1]CDP49770.1 Hypothetical protein PFCIRM129_01975 [Propionibacterium freudenreichii subsp. freudenreichii]CEG88319.1 Hypothetical protein PFCIRM119_06965 [Propionibacterium freudenreichii]CEG92031.1 Hypothetical protein PFCIRM121_02390 [Propionibacterium freudenreichii]CEH01871.1 Hypothetical protein PFCIRM125_00210 [Propionibacterium freudenreichii]